MGVILTYVHTYVQYINLCHDLIAVNSCSVPSARLWAHISGWSRLTDVMHGFCRPTVVNTSCAIPYIAQSSVYPSSMADPKLNQTKDRATYI